MLQKILATSLSVLHNYFVNSKSFSKIVLSVQYIIIIVIIVIISQYIGITEYFM